MQVGVLRCGDHAVLLYNIGTPHHSSGIMWSQIMTRTQRTSLLLRCAPSFGNGVTSLHHRPVMWIQRGGIMPRCAPRVVPIQPNRQCSFAMQHARQCNALQWNCVAFHAPHQKIYALEGVEVTRLDHGDLSNLHALRIGHWDGIWCC